MSNSTDPDQLASSEVNRSGSSVCKGRAYPGSAGRGLRTSMVRCTDTKGKNSDRKPKDIYPKSTVEISQ